jgi:hypothetical protein
VQQACERLLLLQATLTNSFGVSDHVIVSSHDGWAKGAALYYQNMAIIHTPVSSTALPHQSAKTANLAPGLLVGVAVACFVLGALAAVVGKLPVPTSLLPFYQ